MIDNDTGLKQPVEEVLQVISSYYSSPDGLQKEYEPRIKELEEELLKIERTIAMWVQNKEVIEQKIRGIETVRDIRIKRVRELYSVMEQNKPY